MHKININNEQVRTDLILEQDFIKNKDLVRRKEKHFTITSNTHEENKYTTIHFKDITDKDEYSDLKSVLLKELKRIIKIKENDIILVVGLGNEKSTPDSLGPKTIEHILVTRYLKIFNELDNDYSNVAIYKPDVYGNTGIESIDIIRSIVNNIKPTKLIVIDALKANNLKRLTRTIQITDSGIMPGSGVYNNRGEISKKTMNCEVYAIGIPTVVDIATIINTYSTKEKALDENFIVTPTNIDFVIERLSYLLGETLNNLFHKAYLRQIKNK